MLVYEVDDVVQIGITLNVYRGSLKPPAEAEGDQTRRDKTTRMCPYVLPYKICKLVDVLHLRQLEDTKTFVATSWSRIETINPCGSAIFELEASVSSTRFEVRVKIPQNSAKALASLLFRKEKPDLDAEPGPAPKQKKKGAPKGTDVDVKGLGKDQNSYPRSENGFERIQNTICNHKKMYERLLGKPIVNEAGEFTLFKHHGKHYQWTEVCRRVPKWFEAQPEMKVGFSGKVAEKLTSVAPIAGSDPCIFKHFLRDCMEGTFDLVPED